jgi:hypothetical protein
LRQTAAEGALLRRPNSQIRRARDAPSIETSSYTEQTVEGQQIHFGWLDRRSAHV